MPAPPTRLDLHGRLLVLTALAATPFCLQRAYFISPDSSQRTFLQWAVALGAATYALFGLRRPVRRPSLGTALVILFALWSLTTALWSREPLFTLHEWTALAAGIIIYLLIIASRLDTPSILFPALWVIIITAGFNALLGNLQFVVQFGHRRETELTIWLTKFLGYGHYALPGKLNVRAFFGHPNFLAAYLTPAAALTAHMLWAKRDVRRGLLAVVPLIALSAVTILCSEELRHRPSFWLVPAGLALIGGLIWAPRRFQRLFLTLLLLCLVAGIVICRSRSCWLAFFVMLFAAAAVAWRHRRLRRRHVLALAVTVLIAVTGVLGLRAYKLNTRSWEQVATLQSATARMYDFGLASRMFREHPLFGRGYGTFKIDYYNALVDFQMRDRSADLYVPHLSEVQGRPPQHVHDDYFEIALETGVVGLVLFLGILAWTAARLGAVILRPPAGSRTWLALALGCALLAILSDATMSFPLNLPLTASLFWCLLALAHRLVLEAEAEGRIQPAARAS